MKPKAESEILTEVIPELWSVEDPVRNRRYVAGLFHRDGRGNLTVQNLQVVLVTYKQKVLVLKSCSLKK